MIKKKLTLGALGLIVLLVSACQFFEIKNNAEAVSKVENSTVFLADELQTKNNRQVANDQSAKCDLETDKCSGKELNQAQIAKTLFLTDQVAEKLMEIEATEKLAGRDFKVALIGRRGSNLKKFQPLQDKDAYGNTISVEQLVQKIISQSQAVANNTEAGSTGASGSINPIVMQDYFDRSRTLKYSHLGIAIKGMNLKDKTGKVVTKADAGQWAVVHLLYSCEDQKQSYVFRGTLSHFFYDHMSDYGAQILVPEQGLQNNLEDILLKDYLGKNWIEKQYNAIALANDLSQQNSNQWVLEVLAAAFYPAGTVKDRAQAQEILRKTDYHETKVTPTGLYSALTIPFVSKIVSGIMPTVCMKYQPNIQKYGIGEIITALSLEEYLRLNKRLSSTFEVQLTSEDVKELDSDLGPKKKYENTNPNF